MINSIGKYQKKKTNQNQRIYFITCWRMNISKENYQCQFYTKTQRNWATSILPHIHIVNHSLADSIHKFVHSWKKKLSLKKERVSKETLKTEYKSV